MVEDKDKVAIVVNAREKVVASEELSSDGELSFDQVVGLAYDPVPSGQYIEFTMSYRNSLGRPPDGRLFVGQSVKIQNGTVFNVTYTDRS